MQKEFTLEVLPEEAADPAMLRHLVAAVAGKKDTSVTGYQVLKHSIDARKKPAKIILKLLAFLDEPPLPRPLMTFDFKEVKPDAPRVIIVGAGPAGLFAALHLLEQGIKPVILERGKDVRERRRDLAVLNREGIINPESNYCFGEGGAGTYSDGKLYTRSSKRGDVQRILQLLVHFGADENILFESHPHIGTNKLPHIITAMRSRILDCGGEVHFGAKVTDILLEGDHCKGVSIAGGGNIKADAVILATGHSARDIFNLLHAKKIHIESKPFALGVRIEHPQSLIDSIQYKCDFRGDNLPAASYSLVEQVADRGVFSFCMCPGGIIATASTAPEELVVNGWSPSKRNNPFANSGMVVSVDSSDLAAFEKYGPLAAMEFQRSVEQKAYQAGGGRFVAPALRMVDFCEGKVSSSLPPCSYVPGVKAVSLKEVLPGFILNRLQKGLQAFGRKMKGYYTNDAVVVATESRTSSPVKIPRDPSTLEHVSIRNLYPCGEGAGYAGGIVSAAMDGEKVASMILIRFA